MSRTLALLLLAACKSANGSQTTPDQGLAGTSAGAPAATAGTTGGTATAIGGSGVAGTSNAAAGRSAAAAAGVGAAAVGGGTGTGASAAGGSAGAAAASGTGGGPSTAGATAEPPSVACNPADRTADAKLISFEEANKNSSNSAPIVPAKGPLKPMIESDPGLATHTIFRPEELGAKLPIVVWANGGCSKNGTLFSRFLLEFASYGFVIVADGTPNGTGTGPLTTEAGPQRQAMDWIVAENERPCSKYYHKLDTTKIAAMGQSCGGLMTLGVSSDPRLTTVVIWNSGLLNPDQKIYDGVHAPMAYFIGGPDDVAYAQAESDFKALTKVPLFYGNLPVGHLATYSQDNGGEFARIGIGWLNWQLKGDMGATGAGMFAGPDCELCKNAMWTVLKKNMD